MLSRRHFLRSRALPLLAAIGFAACGHAFGAAPSRDWPALPSPPDASTYWIAPYLEQNTVPMQIRGFESRLPIAEVEAFYRRWFADKVGFGATRIDAVQMLGARLGDYQLTVEFAQKWPGTVGRLSLAAVYAHDEAKGLAPRDREDRIGRGFPRPAGSRVVSDTLSFDPGQRNRTIVSRNAASVETNALYLREQLLLKGWSLRQDRTVEAGTRSALVFRRQAEELVVTVARQGAGCLVIASQTTPD